MLLCYVILSFWLCFVILCWIACSSCHLFAWIVMRLFLFFFFFFTLKKTNPWQSLMIMMFCIQMWRKEIRQLQQEDQMVIKAKTNTCLSHCFFIVCTIQLFIQSLLIIRGWRWELRSKWRLQVRMQRWGKLLDGSQTFSADSGAHFAGLTPRCSRQRPVWVLHLHRWNI